MLGKGKKGGQPVDEETGQHRKIGMIKNTLKTGWFKTNLDSSPSQNTLSNSSSGSGGRSQSHSNPTASTTKPYSRNSNSTGGAEPLPHGRGLPPMEVNVEKETYNSAKHRGSVDEISVLSSSVVQKCAPSSPTSSGSGSESLESKSTKNQIVGALINGMENDRMADVTLLGRDGARVRATKFVLACRSPALQERLYHDPTQIEVFIGNYGEDAIQAMKEYCHTGGIKGSRLITVKNHETARGLVELASLAKVYGFEPLYGEADSILYQLINTSPWFATACYDAAGIETELIEEFLIQFIKARCPDLLLETNALKAVGQQRLLSLLDGLGCSDADMLRYLEKWLELRGATRENVTFLRSTAAQKLSLERLLEDPSMVSHVRSSGIFDRYLVESIINASPIMEEDEEDDDDDDDEDDEDDDEDDDGMGSARGSSTLATPVSYLLSPETGQYSLGSDTVSPQSSSPTSKEVKKKKKSKEKKEKKDKKEKKKKSKKSSKSKSSESSVASQFDDGHNNNHGEKGHS